MSEVNSLFSLEETATRRKFSLRRSHLEIRMDILSCIKGGYDKPTQVMYKANLSWTALKDHLAALETSELIAGSSYGSRRRYELTERAFQVLAAYEKVLYDISAPFKKTSPSY